MFNISKLKCKWVKCLAPEVAARPDCGDCDDAGGCGGAGGADVRRRRCRPISAAAEGQRAPLRRGAASVCRSAETERSAAPCCLERARNSSPAASPESGPAKLKRKRKNRKKKKTKKIEDKFWTKLERVHWIQSKKSLKKDFFRLKSRPSIQQVGDDPKVHSNRLSIFIRQRTPVESLLIRANFWRISVRKWPKCETKIPKFHKKSAPHAHTEGTTIEKKSVPRSQNVEKRGRNTSERTSIFIGTVRFGPQSAPDQVTDLVWTEAQVVGGQGRCGGGGSGSSGGCHRQNVATFQVKSASDEETNKQINKPTKWSWNDEIIFKMWRMHSNEKFWQKSINGKRVTTKSGITQKNSIDADYTKTNNQRKTELFNWKWINIHLITSGMGCWIRRSNRCPVESWIGRFRRGWSSRDD